LVFVECPRIRPSAKGANLGAKGAVFCLKLDDPMLRQCKPVP
jgi:hypothetical protein